jgi:16S rRNA (guanine1207-N2)-methyltransferase
MAKHSRRLGQREATDDAIRPSEKLLIDAIGNSPAERVLCTSLGRAQFGRQYAANFSEAQVTCLFLDIYLARRAETATETPPANLDILCATDPPDAEFDLAAMPFTQGGEAELTRDLMQSAHERLKIGGQLVVSIDTPKDTWLNEEMQRLFDKVTRKAGQGGIVYLGTKREPLKKLKNFRAEFKFRDGERLISLVTRPGVFSHRRLDLGARALMEAMQISPGNRVLDLGCGSGALSLAAAQRAEGVHVLAIDSHNRAIECTEQSAALNGITAIHTKLNASAKVEEEGTFDVALANPPYYSNYRIAEIFLKGARRALKPGGTVWVVAKSSEWYLDHMPKHFDEVSVQTVRDYAVVRGIQRPESSRRRPGRGGD